MSRPSKPTGAGAGSLARLVRRYNTTWSELATLRGEMFPPGQKVNVDCGQYIGPGIVAADPSCPIHKLAVKIENGNVWWYPLLACSPNDQAQRLAANNPKA